MVYFVQIPDESPMNMEIREFLESVEDDWRHHEVKLTTSTYFPNMTREYVNELKGYKTVLLDTRKTTPNMRPFEKHAVKVGGATNHRYNLSDGVLLKDNHIGAAGSVTKAIEMAKAYAPFVRKIEIETETLEQVKEALDAGADIIMLDNMDNDTMSKAVEMIDGKAQTECSGNVTKERLKEIAEIGVDFVSCGALTHSAMIMDVSLKNLKTID